MGEKAVDESMDSISNDVPCFYRNCSERMKPTCNESQRGRRADLGPLAVSKCLVPVIPEFSCFPNLPLVWVCSGSRLWGLCHLHLQGY